MRIWSLKTSKLCDKHLLAQHHEAHTIWSVIVNKRTGGYANHPEVNRWRGALLPLYKVHEEAVAEMLKRGFKHNSPLWKIYLTTIPSVEKQKYMVEPVSVEFKKLIAKGCKCQIDQSAVDAALAFEKDKIFMDGKYVVNTAEIIKRLNKNIESIVKS